MQNAVNSQSSVPLGALVSYRLPKAAGGQPTQFTHLKAILLTEFFEELGDLLSNKVGIPTRSNGHQGVFHDVGHVLHPVLRFQDTVPEGRQTLHLALALFLCNTLYISYRI